VAQCIAVWDEIDCENAVWSIPKERMKRGKPHNVYLSRQSLDIMIALRTCAGNSRYLLPMSRATFNRITVAVVERAAKQSFATGAVHGSRPAAHRLDAVE